MRRLRASGHQQFISAPKWIFMNSAIISDARVRFYSSETRF